MDALKRIFARLLETAAAYYAVNPARVHGYLVSLLVALAGVAGVVLAAPVVAVIAAVVAVVAPIVVAELTRPKVTPNAYLDGAEEPLDLRE